MAWLDNLWEDSWKGNKRLGGFFEGGSFLELVLPACHKSAFKEGNIKSTAFAGIPAGFGNTLCWYFFYFKCKSHPPILDSNYNEVWKVLLLQMGYENII